MEISKARGLLVSLQETETLYLMNREKKVLDKINKAFEESREILNSTRENYAGVQEIISTISTFTSFLEGIHKSFNNLFDDFSERSVSWENKIDSQLIEIEEEKIKIKNDKLLIAKEKEFVKNSKEGLVALQTQIESKQATLSASYEINKNLWNKIQKNKK